MNQPVFSFKDKLPKTGPRKLLALYGGGIRGVISLEVLAESSANSRRNLRFTQPGQAPELVTEQQTGREKPP